MVRIRASILARVERLVISQLTNRKDTGGAARGKTGPAPRRKRPFPGEATNFFQEIYRFVKDRQKNPEIRPNQPLAFANDWRAQTTTKTQRPDKLTCPRNTTKMKLKLKNDSGMVREVPVGFSWTGFFFQYLVLFSRGLFSRAILLMAVALFLQLSGCVVQCSAGVSAWAHDQNAQDAMNGAYYFFIFAIYLPFALIIGFKLNKWTARYWLDHGYKPVGAGWQEWGPKWGLDSASLPDGATNA